MNPSREARTPAELRHIIQEQCQQLNDERETVKFLREVGANLRGKLLPHVPCYCPVNDRGEEKQHPYCSYHRVNHILEGFEIVMEGYGKEEDSKILTPPSAVVKEKGHA